MYLPIFNFTPVISYTLTDLKFWIMEGFENRDYWLSSQTLEDIARFIHKEIQRLEAKLAIENMLKGDKLQYSFTVYHTGIVRIVIFDYSQQYDAITHIPTEMWNRVNVDVKF